MLTRKQFKQKHAGLSPVELANEWRKYLDANGVRHGRLTGDELAECQRISREAAEVARVAAQRAARRSQIDYDAIHAELVGRGFQLVNESESGSRYYEREGNHVRVSDHSANEATDLWLQRVGGCNVRTVAQAQMV